MTVPLELAKVQIRMAHEALMVATQAGRNTVPETLQYAQVTATLAVAQAVVALLEQGARR